MRAAALALFVVLAPPNAAPGAAVPAAEFGEGDVTPGAGYWLPATCRSLVQLEQAVGEDEAGDAAEARWNLHYRRGYGLIEEQELEAAERSFCLALDAARAFAAGDLRFAETLDELGLVSYLRGDDALAEAMQGAATAEILLALGPPARDQPAEERDRCSLTFATYLGRLGLVFERQGRAAMLKELERSPYLVLGKGYVPAEALAGRLDGLISRYLLAEDTAAADWLQGLEQRLRAELAAP